MEMQRTMSITTISIDQPLIEIPVTFHFVFNKCFLHKFIDNVFILSLITTRQDRSYIRQSTRSRPITEVKYGLAGPVVRWVTTCEAPVLIFLFILRYTHYYIYFSVEVFQSFIFRKLYDNPNLLIDIHQKGNTCTQKLHLSLAPYHSAACLCV